MKQRQRARQWLLCSGIYWWLVLVKEPKVSTQQWLVCVPETGAQHDIAYVPAAALSLSSGCAQRQQGWMLQR